MGATTPGRWVQASDVRVSDDLLLRDGRIVLVQAVRHQAFKGKVYNFSVAELESYAVGHNNVLVHNDPTCFNDLTDSGQANATLDELTESGPPPWQQTVAVVTTEEGPIIAAGGAETDLTAAQEAVALSNGVDVATLPGWDAELTAFIDACRRGLTPTGGVTSNSMCAHCESVLRSFAEGTGFGFGLSNNRRSFTFFRL
jgi:hypothetical protein